VTYLTYDAPLGQTPILEYYRYDVFGQPVIYGPDNQVRQASLYSNRFLFTGREYNANFGFYEYRARAYHPSLGRFMSEDPKLFDAGDYNLFRYCHNDSIDNVDPMGLEENLAQKPISAWDPTGRAWAKKVITGSHIAISIQDALAWRELVGLSTTFARASESSLGGFAMGEVKSNQGQPSRIHRVYDLPTKGTPQDLARAAATKAAAEHEASGDSYGYTAFRENGQTQWFKSEAGVWERGQWIERTYVPRDLPNEAFIANGHVHPKPDVLHHEYHGKYSSFSPQDRLLSRFGPVWKRNWEIHRDVR